MTYLIVLAAFVLGAWAMNGLANMIDRIGAGGPAEQEHLGVPKTARAVTDGRTGAERGGSATNCGTRAAPHHDPRVTILARSQPYYILDPECECGSGLPAKFWTGDGWMCGECYDEREADRELERDWTGRNDAA